MRECRSGMGRKGKILLRVILLLCILMSVSFSIHYLTAYADEARIARQVSGNIVFGPFEFRPPKGYWYWSAGFPIEGLRKGQIFRLSFLESPEDEPDNLLSSGNVVFNVEIMTNQFRDFDSYQKTLSDIQDTETREKSLPQITKDLFKNLSAWYCRESVDEGYQPLTGLHCVTLGKYIVLISAIGFDEKKVLDKASMLRDMMLSFQVSEGK